MKNLSGRGKIPKGGEFLTKDRSDFNVGIDLTAGEFSVDLRLPLRDDKAAYLNLKDLRGRKTVIDLSLGATREIRKRSGAFFAAERAKQEARLA